MGSDIKVGEVMRRHVITLQDDQSVYEAALLMKKHKIGSVIALEGNKAVGILTERDIVRKVVAEGKDAKETKIKEVMSSPLTVITPEITVEEAAKIMREAKIRRLPVIKENGELVGIITEKDLINIFPAVIDLIEEKAKLQE